MKQVQKAIEISDARIQFVSLVDKAANKRQFLITKAKNGSAQFSTLGKILKVDTATHYITGIVYEPLVEDAHGNYMTEEEIKKAAYWFAKNGDEVDVQHSFEAVDGVSVVENYVAPCDMDIDGTPVIKGTWIMTVEVNNTDVWEAVQKGEITGFSMGGIGKYSEEDVNLENISKQAAPAAKDTERKGIFKKLAEAFGFDVIEKGALMDKYKESSKYSSFWNAFYALEDLLYRYNWQTDRYEFENDEATIREALTDFSAIISDILGGGTNGELVTKALAAAAPVNKAGKKMSNSNKKKLDAAYQALTELQEALSEESEDGDETIEKEDISDMNKTETLTLIEETVKKSLEAAGIIAKTADPAPAAATTTPAAAAPAEAKAEPEALDAAVEKAVKKALIECGLIEEEPDEEEPITKATLEEIVSETVNKALEPLLKARGIASNLNDTKPVEKSAPHYLAGIL